MREIHQKNTVRYYLLIILILSFLFFTGDFGLIDVQKTAIVMAVGIDREEDTFIITSQIAIPQASKQGKATETVQLVSRGATVADAFEEINAKTGWYPKLVFCHLIVLGEKAVEQDAFDALDFFLLDEYMSDNCLLATCDGLAKDILNVAALVDPSGSVAIQKILSPHAERVGSVMPTTLREFAIGYYSESQSGFLPIVKIQPQQEQVGGSGSGQEQNGSSGSSGSSSSSGSSGSSQSSQSSESASGSSSSESGSSGGGSQSGSQSGESSSSGGSGGSGGGNEKPVFSAGETALFVGGKRVDKFSQEETFAFNAVKHELRLAAYSVETDDAYCTLTVRRNSPKTKFKVGKDGRATLRVNVAMTAGLLDYSQALPKERLRDAGDVPQGAFEAASKRLTAQIHQTFEKCRAAHCDLFGIVEQLQKLENRRYEELKTDALKNAIINVSVRFTGVR
ncbi:MAG: hypothetical protein IJW60_00205 [Clostridia bacterium]|nr:hypothetical protein [Clostridia bacterium]